MEADTALKATAARRLQEADRQLVAQQEVSAVLQKAAARRLLELGEGKDNFLVQSLNAAARPTSASALPHYDGDAVLIAAATLSRTDNTELIRQLEAESQGIRRLKETHDDHIEHDRPLARRLAGGADNC